MKNKSFCLLVVSIIIITLAFGYFTQPTKKQQHNAKTLSITPKQTYRQDSSKG